MVHMRRGFERLRYFGLRGSELSGCRVSDFGLWVSVNPERFSGELW